MPEQQKQTISYEELLGFYDTAGVDTPLSETPINRFAEVTNIEQNPVVKQAVEQKKPPQKVYQQRPQQIATEGQVATAQELAQGAQTLDELFSALQSFNGCTLKLTAKNTCFAPGREEDMQGIPFVGRSGQLLNRILSAIGLARQDVYIANTIPWRPPGNRTPTPMETELCRPFIERQIELAKPQILVALGGPAMQVLAGVKDGIIRSRGKWLNHKMRNGNTIPIMPTFHLFATHTKPEKACLG